MIQRFKTYGHKKIFLMLSILSISAAEHINGMNPYNTGWDNLINEMEIILGNRIITQQDQQRAKEKIAIERIDKKYFLMSKERVKNIPELKNRVVRLFNALDTIDNNINYYLNDPTNTKFKTLIDGALNNCFKIKNEILTVMGQARIDGNEELRDTADRFEKLAEKIYGTTQTLMDNAQPVAAPKKSKNIFKRILGK